MTRALVRKGWEEFVPGERFRSNGRTVTESDIVTFAGLTGDFYPLHKDAEFARASAFGNRIAHGMLTMSLAIGQVVLTGVYGQSIVALRGIDRLQAQRPIFIGDTIYTEVEVISARQTRRPEHGAVMLAYRVCNQANEVVMTFEVTLLMRSSRVNGVAVDGSVTP